MLCACSNSYVGRGLKGLERCRSLQELRGYRFDVWPRKPPFRTLQPAPDQKWWEAKLPGGDFRLNFDHMGFDGERQSLFGSVLQTGANLFGDELRRLDERLEAFLFSHVEAKFNSSRMFVRDSSRETPWEIHPGNAGQTAENPPLAWGESTTVNFMVSKMVA